MRVVAGSARGRSLRAPTGRTTRPTSDRVRESVFNILTSLGLFGGADLEGEPDGIGVVDLFAGSGALGIEALSRGATSAVFVDSDTTAVASVRDNLRSFGWSEPRARVVRADAGSWVRGAGADDLVRADLVLADPPYAFGGWEELLADLARSGFAGLAVLEAGDEVDAGEAWDVVRVRRYGATVVSLVRPAVPAGVLADSKGGV
jgi:16S rRNA (guanine966-N2)-methyltransferase